VFPTESSTTNKSSHNATVTSLIVCCGFIVCWSVNEIIYFLSFVGYHVDRSNWLYHFSVVLVKTNSCINPFVYAAKYGEFQNGVRRMVARLTGNPQNIEGGLVMTSIINQQAGSTVVT